MNYWIRFGKLTVEVFFSWGWQWRNYFEFILCIGFSWGQFWNKWFYKGIDGNCLWLGSSLSNHLTCTKGIFNLDMIICEIIQIENPRHVIDAMSSLKLILNFWSLGIGFWFVGICILCRNLLQWMKMDISDKKDGSFLLKFKRRKKNWKRDRRSKFDQLLEINWDCIVILVNSLNYVWILFVICWLRILVLIGFSLKFSLWTEGFFKGLTPCYFFYGYRSFWRCKGVKLPFFPHSINPRANFKDFRDYWGCEWLVLIIRKWFGSWLWIGWIFLLFD